MLDNMVSHWTKCIDPDFALKNKKKKKSVKANLQYQNILVQSKMKIPLKYFVLLKQKNKNKKNKPKTKYPKHCTLNIQGQLAITGPETRTNTDPITGEIVR